ncbi:hypothetical protein AB1N83_012405 [Pleurotus pulmonarius]
MATAQWDVETMGLDLTGEPLQEYIVAGQWVDMVRIVGSPTVWSSSRIGGQLIKTCPVGVLLSNDTIGGMVLGNIHVPVFGVLLLLRRSLYYILRNPLLITNTTSHRRDSELLFNLRSCLVVGSRIRVGFASQIAGRIQGAQFSKLSDAVRSEAVVAAPSFAATYYIWPRPNSGAASAYASTAIRPLLVPCTIVARAS